MRKKLTSWIILALIVSLITGCGGQKGKELTLDLVGGQRTGIYVGDVNEQGLPDGNGKFTTENSNGEKYTYEGEFSNGHYVGIGKLTFENGLVLIAKHENDETVAFYTKEELATIYADPNKYKDYYVLLVGKVYNVIGKADNGATQFQMYADAENSNYNTVVEVAEDVAINDGDYVAVLGTVVKELTYKNMLGAEMTAMAVSALNVQLVDYKTAVRPPISSYDFTDFSITQYGYQVEITSIEFAEAETRVYVTVNNNGNSEFTLYNWGSSVVQNGVQYNEQPNFFADYPEVASNLRPGTSSNGVFVYPPMQEQDMTIYFKAYSSNWQQRINDYQFTVTF